MIGIEDITSLDKLNNAYRECAKVCPWKESVQRYGSNMLLNNLQLQRDIRNGCYHLSQTTDFRLTERGKVRNINAPNIRDRIIQKVLMKDVLLPALTPKLIYDNYASLKGKGTSLARKRMDILLHRYIRKYGTDGYILLVDIRKYFDNVNHEKLKVMLREDLQKIANKDVIQLIEYIIDHSSEGGKGLNLGSENPQIYAVYYLYQLDNYIKIVKGVKYYGRYMDDMFVISDSKEELKELLDGIENILSLLGLELNKKKTHIVKLSHGFTWLQIKYNITATGHLIKRLAKNKIIREKRRLKAFARLVNRDTMRLVDVLNCYLSWRGSTIASCTYYHKSISSVDKLYKSLFGSKRPIEEKTCNSIIFERIFSSADKNDIRHIINKTENSEIRLHKKRE